MKQVIIILATMFAINVHAQTNADKIIGTWLSSDKESHLEIYKSGNKYFGKIVWIKDQIDPKTGKPQLDTKNPDASKRTQPIIGLVIMTNLEYDADDEEWSGGKIYDPESGDTYKLKVTIKDTILSMRGYVGISMFGRTEKWTRIK